MCECVQGGVRSNPVAGLSFPPVDVKVLNLAKTFKGHLMSVSSLAMHPTKPIVVCSPPLGPPTIGLLSCRWLSIDMYMGTHVCIHVYTCIYVCICTAMAIAICMKSMFGLLWGQAKFASSVTHHCLAHHHCASNCACVMDPTWQVPFTVWDLYLKVGPIVRS